MAESEAKKESTPEYNFAVGHPHPSMNLSKDLIRKCFTKHLSDDNTTYFTESMDYGLNNGSWYFRSSLADRINKLISMNKDKSLQKYTSISGTEIVLTTGASQSMELLLFHLKRLKRESNPQSKNIVLCEDPSYFLFPPIVENIDCKILGVPFKNNGLDFQHFEEILNEYSNDIVCFYVIPSHQNPMGLTYSIADRVKLITLCQRYKVHIIADEVYNLLSFDEDIMAIPFLSSMEQTLFPPFDLEENEKNESKTECVDREYYCYSISSFSKIIGPGFRIGFVYSANEQLMQRIVDNTGSIRSGGCMTQFTPSIIRYLLEPDIDGDGNEEDAAMTGHLLKVKRALGRKCKALCDTLRQYDTENVLKFKDPTGGYFMWIEMPADKIQNVSDGKGNVKYFGGLDLSSTFGPVAKKLQFENDQNMEMRKEYFSNCVRLCFACLSEEEIIAGARQFVGAVYGKKFSPPPMSRL